MNYQLVYRQVGTKHGLSCHGNYNTEAEARAAAAHFLKSYPTQYDVYISRPFLKIKLKDSPLVIEEIEY